LPAHQGLAFPAPRVARNLTIRHVAAHTGIVDAVIRVALAFGRVSQDAEPMVVPHRTLAVPAAHQIEAAGKPLAVRRAGHLAAGTQRTGLHVGDLVPAAREIGQLLVLGAGLRCGWGGLCDQGRRGERRDGGGDESDRDLHGRPPDVEGAKTYARRTSTATTVDEVRTGR